MSGRDGGPAFPVTWDMGGESVATPGMTLRDYFAGQVLLGGGFADMGPRTIAQICYKMADAMLAERDR